MKVGHVAAPLTADAGEAIRAVPVRRPGRWLGTALVVLAAVWLVNALVTNDAFQWGTVAAYFTDPEILHGLWITIALTALTMLVGIVLGVVLAVMRLSPNPLVSNASAAYVWFFRGTPVLVQLIFWFNLASLYPVLRLGVPFGGPEFWSGSANNLITPFLAALLGLGLNEGAYMAEIVRGGILGVESGQVEAAKALGFRPLQTMRRIVLPQAMRMIIPPTGNQTIGMLKYTALASVVAVPELLHSAQSIYNRTFETIPLLIVASLWYLILTTVLSVVQYYIERHYARGSARALPRTPLARMFDRLRPARGRTR
jgi:polar amino acid transport system permease protein